MLRLFDVEPVVQEWQKHQTQVRAGELSDSL
jgi:hypothetical protein